MRQTARTSIPAEPNAFSCLLPSFFPEIVIDGLKALAKVQDCVMLAREQRVYTDASLFGKLFEAVTQELVSHEYFALLFGQFVQGRIHLLEQHTSGVGRLRSSVWRGQQILPLGGLAAL